MKKNNQNKSQLDKDKDKIKLYSLIPKQDIDSNANIDIIKYVIDNKNNLNIGITGSYGSGKSSFIKSYAEKYKKKLLYISLAILNEKNVYKSESILDGRLEKAIVNQIIHQINPSAISQSFLKSKKENKYFINTLFIAIWICLFRKERIPQRNLRCIAAQ